MIVNFYTFPLQVRPGGARVQHEVFKHATQIYALLLVVEGGPNTLQVVADAVASKTPVVVGRFLL